jgi:myo-inositol-1-phosphate synthase
MTLGVMLPGLGAVSSTLIAGVEAVRRGLALPVGSLTQLGRLDGDGRPGLIRERLPLAGLDDLRFAAWDIFPDDAHAAARKARVLDAGLLDLLRGPLEAIRPFPAVHDPAFLKRLAGPHVKARAGKRAWAEALREDIRGFLAGSGCSRAVMIFCGSTERHLEPAPCHASLDLFEEGLDADDPAISPTQLYAYAALREGLPFANASPNRSVDLPALRELAERAGRPVAGRDLKTGQTLVKTILAPGLKSRLLGMHGWFSTNILGNRDGEVLADPGSLETKVRSKLSVLQSLLEPELYPELYGDVHHQVDINYYPPRGDNKEGWDTVDLFGWLGYPMQLKINFLCRDSVLAAPLVLDLALFLDLAARRGLAGVQDWLSFYFKSPLAPPGVEAPHDLREQEARLREALRGPLDGLRNFLPRAPIGSADESGVNA